MKRLITEKDQQDDASEPHAEPAGLPTLRLLLTTASRIDGSAQQRVADALGIEIADYYGLTETGGVCILQEPGREYTDGSIGVPADCLCEIRAGDDTTSSISTPRT